MADMRVLSSQLLFESFTFIEIYGYLISRNIPTKHLLDRGAIVTATITSKHYRKYVISRGTWNSMCNNRYHDSKSLWTLTASKIWTVCQNSLCWPERWSYCWLLSYKNKSFRRPSKWWGSCKEEEKEHKGLGKKQIHP